jgi:hypothetical protein
MKYTPLTAYVQGRGQRLTDPTQQDIVRPSEIPPLPIPPSQEVPATDDTISVEIIGGYNYVWYTEPRRILAPVPAAKSK